MNVPPPPLAGRVHRAVDADLPYGSLLDPHLSLSLFLHVSGEQRSDMGDEGEGGC